ncbi:fatty acid desaturase family protein [Crocinitomix catalasitica]|uniref:fatty acid desaturase family protein n=1 Tax=Crocinitomix catalasitica TaxID=184607 RepID=UPI00055E92C9|nr:acyl-CoA desaturase [Crocinitomix catalasitica]
MEKSHKQLKPIKFSNIIGRDFNTTLKKRVRTYFKENNISKYANTNMKVKTAFMVLLYFTPYFLMIFGAVTNVWLIALCWVVMGFGVAGIGLSVMHDANHGAYSKNEKVNYFVGRIVNLVGGYAPTWKIQHNILHHSYTNIHGYDEDISPALPLLRFSPTDKYIKAHRFQFIYAWFFYSLMTVMWITTKDFQQLFRYKKMDLTKTENIKFGKLFMELLLTKVVYYAYVLVIPLLVLDISWWLIPIFILMMHLIAGFTLAIVFQPAHVIPDTQFPVPETDLTIENNWAIHQLQTTANFAPKSRILYWLIGGLNYQIEHHLFPNICHVHYKKLSVIVKQTAKEYGIPYYSEPTFISAIISHGKMLKQLGMPTAANLAKA